MEVQIFWPPPLPPVTIPSKHLISTLDCFTPLPAGVRTLLMEAPSYKIPKLGIPESQRISEANLWANKKGASHVLWSNYLGAKVRAMKNRHQFYFYIFCCHIAMRPREIAQVYDLKFHAWETLLQHSCFNKRTMLNLWRRRLWKRTKNKQARTMVNLFFTDFPAYSDSLGTREKCHCNRMSL